MNTDLAQYHELYLTTSRELVDLMKANLQKLQHNIEDINAIKELHRAAHSLKSQSLVMGYQQIGIVNRHLEAFFKLVKEKELIFNQKYYDMVTNIVTHVEHAISDIRNSENEPDLAQDIETLKKHTNIEN